MPKAIAIQLRLRGVDVLTAFEDGGHRLSDPDLLRRAGDLGRVLFSEDDDLLAIAAECQRNGAPFAGLIYGHQLNLPIGKAVSDLELLARCVEPEEFRNHIEFLPL